MMELHLRDPDATGALGARLAVTQVMPAIVHLRGELGAGKSTLARAWLRALGVTGTIRSPTYTLVERYPLPGGGEALHLDLYRIAGAGELEFLALDDVVQALWLVEWPERGGGMLPAADLRIDLAVAGNGRVALLSGSSPIGSAWLGRLSEYHSLHDLNDP